MTIRLPKASVLAGAAILLVLLLLPLLAYLTGQPYWLGVAARIVALSIAAVSLGFLVGYVGLVSLGHSVFLLSGGYTVALLANAGIEAGPVHWLLAALISGLLAAALGAIALRTTGVHFIMLTLALSQMIYFAMVTMRSIGGDEGLPLAVRSDFSPFLDAADPYGLYALVLVTGVICFGGLAAITRTSYGLALLGCKSNERRMRSLGHRVYLYKLSAFVIGGAVCGLAGAMLANISGFVSPEYGAWVRSGELLVAVIVGGVGSLIGPFLGSLFLFVAEHILSDFMEHWPLVIGPALVVIVLLKPNGLWPAGRGGEG